MKRRKFLQAAGLACAGVSSALGDEKPETQRRQVLVTSAESRLAQAITTHIENEFDVFLTSPEEITTVHPSVKSDLGHDQSINALVRGLDAIVFVNEAPANADAAGLIDYRTRNLYNLLRAASEENVKKVILLSSLELMTGYDEELDVKEVWKPTVTTDPRLLSYHLAEFTTREFARARKIDVAVLRLGKVISADKVEGQPFDPMWVDERDVAQSVASAVRTDFEDTDYRIGRWLIFHIQSSNPAARFSSDRARGRLEYKPEHLADF